MRLPVGVDNAEVARVATRADLRTWFQNIVRTESTGLRIMMFEFQDLRVFKPVHLLTVSGPRYIGTLTIGSGAMADAIGPI